VWQHSIKLGAKRHWILDDNICCFYRLNRNQKIRVDTPDIFRHAEDFVDRYENVALAGFQYDFFAPRKDKWPPFYLNNRVYSNILIENNIRSLSGEPYRWRGKYNEDTDLSIRVLKDGWCTILFLAFLAGKKSTMTMRGGNTDELYPGDGREKMADSLINQHPDIVTKVWKWDRWQHHVYYQNLFPNKLRENGNG
jgi:hypothetical protein